MDAGKNESITLGSRTGIVSQTVAGMQKEIEEVVEVVKDSATVWKNIKKINDNIGEVIADKVAGTLGISSGEIQNSTATKKSTEKGI